MGVPVEGERRPKAHRVSRVDNVDEGILIETKGDANATPDPRPVLVPESGQAMKVRWHVPLAGYAVHFVRTPLGWALAVMVPATLLCIVTLRRIWTGEERPVAKPGVA